MALADLCPPFGRAGADNAVLNKCNTSQPMKDVPQKKETNLRSEGIQSWRSIFDLMI